MDDYTVTKANEIKLTAKQAAFCHYYLANNGNGTQAAIKAGYPKNSAGTIHQKLC